MGGAAATPFPHGRVTEGGFRDRPGAGGSRIGSGTLSPMAIEELLLVGGAAGVGKSSVAWEVSAQPPTPRLQWQAPNTKSTCGPA